MSRRTCTKVGYASPNAAKHALRLLKNHGMKRWYQCDECHKYHVTSNPDKLRERNK